MLAPTLGGVAVAGMALAVASFVGCRLRGVQRRIPRPRISLAASPGVIFPNVGAERASALASRLWKELGPPSGDPAKEAEWLDAFAPDAIVEDLYLLAEPIAAGGAGAKAYLANKAECGRFIVDRMTDGRSSCGFTWHLEEDGVDGIGIRGTTFIALDGSGRISYLREICEPLYKPGDQTVELLKAIGAGSVATFDGGQPLRKRQPSGASDLCRYLWSELQGKAPPDEALTFFSEGALYEDFNYDRPLLGKQEIGAFLRKFADVKALKFVAERFSDGDRACCFTWHVEIAGVPADAPDVRGISFYELDSTGRISYVRDIPESVLKPPPLQALASRLRPRLRTFQPRALAGDPLEASSDTTGSAVKSDDRDCECLPDGSIVWQSGATVHPSAVLSRTVTGIDGCPRPLSAELVGARGAVVVFTRHLG